MKFRNLDNGSIYDVVNKELIPSYEANERFEKVVEAEPKATKAVERKTAKK